LRLSHGGKVNERKALGCALSTLSLGKITSVSVGATVSMVGTAIGLRVRATTELTISKAAAGFRRRTCSSRA